MNEYQTIIDGHIFLLNQRGYSEAALNNTNLSGTLMNKFECAFEKAVVASYPNKQIQNFFLDTLGFFCAGSDTISFRFHYQFDPTRQTLKLQTLVAKLCNMQKIYFLKKSSYLPESIRIYLALARQNAISIKKTLEKPIR